MSAPTPVHLDSRPKKRRRKTLSSGLLSYCRHYRCNVRRPKMRWRLVNAPAGERCRKLFCDGRIEKRCAVRLFLSPRYPDITFDLSAETFTCPYCSGYFSRSLCAPKRGEQCGPERNGGWRSWIAQHGGGSNRPACERNSWGSRLDLCSS
jgi:hypothetical protein